MTQRLRVALALVAATATIGGTAYAAPKPTTKAPAAVQEVISIERTAKHGLAALALIGKVKADRTAGFFATMDRTKYGTALGSMVDFNQASGLTKYGHGEAAPLCDAPIVCEVDQATGTLTFTITETDDADTAGLWTGRTRFLAIRGTSIDIVVAPVGFKVTRHTSLTFTRVTRDQADADGVGFDNVGAEVFRSAEQRGGSKGSFAVLQLPCEGAGAGAATFSATGDTLPSVVECNPTENTGGPNVYLITVGVYRYSDRPGLYSRESSKGTLWQVNGAVSGVSGSVTRLFVLNY